MTDRELLLWNMTAEQFAAFDVQLYLDTHPNDAQALNLFNHYRRNAEGYRQEYEAKYGPVSSDAVAGASWQWLDDPWPWERGAN